MLRLEKLVVTHSIFGVYQIEEGGKKITFLILDTRGLYIYVPVVLQQILLSDCSCG